MHSRTAWYLVTAALAVAPPCSAQTRSSSPDTVDVAVGSSLVDFSRHRPGAQRAVSTVTMNGQTRSMPPVVWTFRFDEVGGTPRLLVRGTPETAPSAGGPMTAPPTTTVLDRKSLAFLQLLAEDESTVLLSANGLSVHGQVPAPGGSRPVDVTLTEPAFYNALADLVAESLPKRTGVVYRLPLWGLSSTSVEHHLYQFVRQEDVEVLGRTYPKAWVLEDRSTDGTLLGTMWLVDGPPELVRWIITMPGRPTVELEQEPADSSR
jgi:hypothetical protein